MAGPCGGLVAPPPLPSPLLTAAVRTPRWAWILARPHICRSSVSQDGAALLPTEQSSGSTRIASKVSASGSVQSDQPYVAATTSSENDTNGNDAPASPGLGSLLAKRQARLRRLQRKAEKAAAAAAAAAAKPNRQPPPRSSSDDSSHSGSDGIDDGYSIIQQQHTRTGVRIERLLVTAAGDAEGAAELAQRWQRWLLLNGEVSRDEDADRALTERINAALSWHAVELELRAYPAAPNQHHVAAALSRLALLRQQKTAGPPSAAAATETAALPADSRQFYSDQQDQQQQQQQQRQQLRPPVRPPAPEALTDHQQDLLDALSSCLDGQWHALGRIQLCAILVGLARLDQTLTPDQEQQALAAVARAAPTLLRRQVVSCLWALARMWVAPPHAWLRNCLDTSKVCGGGGMVLQEPLPPQGLVSLLWALSRWRAPLRKVEKRALLRAARDCTAASGPQVLAVTGWAVARLGLSVRPAREWAEEWASAVTRAARGANGHDVAMSLWAAASLELPAVEMKGLRRGDDVAAAAAAAQGAAGAGGSAGGSEVEEGDWEEGEEAVLSFVGAGGTAETITEPAAAATAEEAHQYATWRPPYHLLGALAHQAAAVAVVGPNNSSSGGGSTDGASASELVVSLWSLGRLCFRPRPVELRALANGIAAAAAAGELSPQGYAMTVCALARLQAQPGTRWLDAFLSHAYEVLPLFAPREAAGLLMGLAALRHIPPESWMRVWWWDTAGKLPEFGPQELANSLRAAVQLGQAPPAPWLRAWHARSLALLRSGALGWRALGMALPAFAQLERAPGQQWMEEFWRQSVGSGGGSSGSSMGGGAGGQSHMRYWNAYTSERIIWALARLKVQPPAAWSRAFFEHTLLLLPTCSALGLSNFVWALATLHVQPPDPWMRACAMRLADTNALAGAKVKVGVRRPLAAGGCGSTVSFSSSHGALSCSQIETQQQVAPHGRRFDVGVGVGAAAGSVVLSHSLLAQALWGLERLDPEGKWVPRGGLVRWQDV